MNKYLKILNEFMNMSLYSTDDVFNKFETDKDGKIFYVNGHKFYFKQGTRNDRILLVAHADTVWDKRYNKDISKLYKEGKLPSKSEFMINGENEYQSNGDFGIGADDRAGAAIAWILKDSGNSILITDEEEIGAKTAIAIMENSDWENIINCHRYILQFDMNGTEEFKCYSAGSEDFKTMIEIVTHYKMRPNYSYTDVKFLGKKICGANLSIGYYNEHTNEEILNKKEWLRALKTALNLSKQEHQQFFIEPEFGDKYSLNESEE